MSSVKSPTSITTMSSVNFSSVEHGVAFSPPHIPASHADIDPATDTKKSMHKSQYLQGMKPSILMENKKLQASEIDAKQKKFQLLFVLFHFRFVLIFWDTGGGDGGRLVVLFQY